MALISYFTVSSGFVSECQGSTTVDYFFYRVTLNSTTSIDDSGGIHWPVVVCLLAAWSIVALCCMRGISTSGKVSRTTSCQFLPFMLLLLQRSTLLFQRFIPVLQPTTRGRLGFLWVLLGCLIQWSVNSPHCSPSGCLRHRYPALRSAGNLSDPWSDT